MTNKVASIPGKRRLAVPALSLALLLTLSLTLPGCPNEPDPAAIARDDPIRPALSAWAQTRFAANNHPTPDFSPWRELHSHALTALFPDHRFFHVSWDEKPRPGCGRSNAASGALGLSLVLACHRDTGAWTEIPGSGNYEPYGRLLARQKVELKTDAQARLVWEGFCDLHQKHWRDHGMERKTDRTWHLGIVTIDGVRYFYRIDLDESGAVLAAKLHAQPAAPQALSPK